MADFTQTLGKLASGKRLDEIEAEAAFSAIMAGEVEPIAISSFLTALAVRTESVEEITGGAKVMRKHADKISAPHSIVDTCGTGGSGIDTFNVSTAAAFICAAGGVPVAKHGNRAASSKSGSADVLEALGGSLDISFEDVEGALKETGFTFMFARAHHKAMRHVAPVRGALKFKTVFNLLGPLSNPASAKRQVLGVFDEKWLEPLANVLNVLGSEHVWLVHGRDGLDEITTTTETDIVELKGGAIKRFTISPEDVGMPRRDLAEIIGGDPAYNARAIMGLFDGELSAFRDITLINAAAALLVGDKVGTLQDGVSMATDLVDTGAAKDALSQWVDYTTKAFRKISDG